MCEQLCQIDHPDPITKMPSRRSLVSVLPRVIRLTLLTSLPGPGRCSACQCDHHSTLPLPQPDRGRGSQGLAAAAGGGVFGGPSRSSRSNGSISVVPEFVAVMSLEL